MVSIGKPEAGQQLVEHLEIPNGSEYLFVDPENILYDALHLNKGIKETFFSPGTPFAFLDRFTKKDGTKELKEVLSKWSKAFFIPPKQEQAFIQGGTFVFDGDETVFAHYDESTGAHSDIQQVIDFAKKRIENSSEKASEFA
mmetsp:Transcript_8656/g.15794  ORF Transcript_8656/g.15794 Transcript_8656/m.15794 type:complete len:142 (-) Transcript_8656:245-670(-)